METDAVEVTEKSFCFTLFRKFLKEVCVVSFTGLYVTCFMGKSVGI